MMPVKEIMALRPIEPGPPIIVIDETTIQETVDAGPTCGCHEKHQMIQNYKPFVPGGVNPYRRRKIPGEEGLQIEWQQARIGSYDLIFDRPVAIHENELPHNYRKPKHHEDYKLQDLMYLRPPQYSDEYFRKKMRECRREHVENCDCSFE